MTLCRQDRRHSYNFFKKKQKKLSEARPESFSATTGDPKQ